MNLDTRTVVLLGLIAAIVFALWWLTKRDWNRTPGNSVDATQHAYPRRPEDPLGELRFHTSRLLTDTERELLQSLSNAYPELTFWVDVGAFRLLRPGFRRKKNETETERYDGMNKLLSFYAVDIVAFNNQYEPQFVGLVVPPDIGGMLAVSRPFQERLEHLCLWLQSARLPYVFIREGEATGALLRKIRFALDHPTATEEQIEASASESMDPPLIPIIGSIESTRQRGRLTQRRIAPRAKSKNPKPGSPTSDAVSIPETLPQEETPA